MNVHTMDYVMKKAIKWMKLSASNIVNLFQISEKGKGIPAGCRAFSACNLLQMFCFPSVAMPAHVGLW